MKGRYFCEDEPERGEAAPQGEDGSLVVGGQGGVGVAGAGDYKPQVDNLELEHLLILDHSSQLTNNKPQQKEANPTSTVIADVEPTTEASAAKASAVGSQWAAI